MKQIFLSILMLLLPMMASADDSGSCGNKVTYYYEEVTHNLTLSGSGRMDEYYYDEDKVPWKSYRSDIENVIIEDGVTSIGGGAFRDCCNLKSISISKSVTEIGPGVILGCNELIYIKIDKENKVFDSRDDCNAIITTRFNSLWCGCKNTVIPNTVTGINSEAFFMCNGLTSITIPSSVTGIGPRAFASCI